MSRSIADQLRNARDTQGLSQVQLAKKARLSQSVVSRIERGDAKATTLGRLRRMAKALRVPVDEQDLRATVLPSTAITRSRWCANVACPSVVPSPLASTVVWVPTFRPAGIAGGPKCAICGELLRDACPACDRACSRGSRCTQCGAELVDASKLREPDRTPAQWQAERDVRRQALRDQRRQVRPCV